VGKTSLRGGKGKKGGGMMDELSNLGAWEKEISDCPVRVIGD